MSFLNIPESSVPAVMSYLTSQLKDAAENDPEPVLVMIGDVGADLPPSLISIGEVRRTEAPETFIGSGQLHWLNERYDITITASAWSGSGADEGSTDQVLALVSRAWQLATYIETVVRSDPSLGELVDQAYPAQTVSLPAEVTADPPGTLVEVAVQIHVEKLN